MNRLSLHNASLAGNPAATQTLLFVNGLGTDQRVWQPLAKAFQDRFRLVFFDHVGSLPDSQEHFRAHQLHYLNVTGYASDMLALCDELALEGSITLVGHSVGGLAGMIAAAQRPKQFSKLVLIGTSPRYLDDDGYRGGFSKKDVNAIYDTVSRDYAGWAQALSTRVVDAPERPDLVSHFAETLVRIPREMMLTMLCSILQTDHRKVLPQIVTPTLLIQSRGDVFVPEEVARYLKQHLPNSELRLIDAHGHLPHLTAPEAVVAAMRGFIDG